MNNRSKSSNNLKKSNFSKSPNISNHSKFKGKSINRTTLIKGNIKLKSNLSKS